MAPHCPLELGPWAGQTRPSTPSTSSPCSPPLPQLSPPPPAAASGSPRVSASPWPPSLRARPFPLMGGPSSFFTWLNLGVPLPGRRFLPLSPQRCRLGAAGGPGIGTQPQVSIGDSCVGPTWAWGDRGCGCSQTQQSGEGGPAPCPARVGHIPPAAQVPSQRSPSLFPPADVSGSRSCPQDLYESPAAHPTGPPHGELATGLGSPRGKCLSPSPSQACPTPGSQVAKGLRAHLLYCFPRGTLGRGLTPLSLSGAPLPSCGAKDNFPTQRGRCESGRC